MLNDEFQMTNSEYCASGVVGVCAPAVDSMSRRSSGVVRHSSFVLRHFRAAFTLVELLVAIAIIGILAGLLLGVAASAVESGREARTKAMIARIHTLVLQHYDTYKDRRAPINDNNAALKSLTGQNRARARLYALRELMLMEMPDRWSDVLLKSPDDVGALNDLENVSPIYLKPPTTSSTYGGVTPLNEAYRRQYFSMLESPGVTREAIKSNQAAECLYMIVMFATADGEARSLFNENSIGDTDQDGAYEFLDGWGRPISWIRWPAGFESDLQPNARRLGGDPTVAEWLTVATQDHDPYDPFLVDPPAFRTVPLIFSSGADGRYDLYTARESAVWRLSGPNPVLLPYARVTSDAGDFFLGSPMNEAQDAVEPNAAADNITNHSIVAE